jgi:hypothetical protein
VLIDRADAIESAFSVAGDVAGASRAGRMTVSIRRFFTLVSDASRDPHHMWQAVTTGYDYRLDGTDGREILAYHWHPSGGAPKHYHIFTSAQALAHCGVSYRRRISVRALSRLCRC